jgi:hypothetical protein
MKMIHEFGYVWDNITVQAMSVSLQNSEIILLSGLLFKKFLSISKSCVQFLLNVVRMFYHVYVSVCFCMLTHVCTCVYTYRVSFTFIFFIIYRKIEEQMGKNINDKI